MTGRFGGVLTAMVTPFASDGALDLDAARDVARFLAANGNEGLVVAGTTGESPVLTDDEPAMSDAASAYSTPPAVAVPGWAYAGVPAGPGSQSTRSMHSGGQRMERDGALRGRIELESEEGQGSTCRMVLPASTSQPSSGRAMLGYACRG